MNLHEMQYCDDRIEDILRDLRKSNSKYSAYCQTDGELFARIKNIITKQGGIFISDSERERITELMEQQEHIQSIVCREIYRQGFLDHLRLIMAAK